MTDDRASLEGEMRRAWYDGWTHREANNVEDETALEPSEHWPHSDTHKRIAALARAPEPSARVEAPIDMILYCPHCHLQHVDEPTQYGERIRWDNPPHRSHLCRVEDGGCGCIWRPADVATNGVRAIETAGKADNWDAARITEPSARGEAPFIYLHEHDTQPREFDEDPLTENAIQAGWRQTPLYTEAALRSRSDLREWRTIDSAPRDGSAFLLFAPLCGWQYFVCHWVERSGGFWSTLDSDFQPFFGGEKALSTPTHWMPLPATPITAAGDGG